MVAECREQRQQDDKLSKWTVAARLWVSTEYENIDSQLQAEAIIDLTYSTLERGDIDKLRGYSRSPSPSLALGTLRCALDQIWDP